MIYELFSNEFFAIRTVCLLIYWSILLSTLQYLLNYRQLLSDSGILSWRIMKNFPEKLFGQQIFKFFQSYRTFWFVLILRVIIIITDVLFADSLSFYHCFNLGIILLLSMIIAVRTKFSLTGATALSSMILIILFITSINPNSKLTALGLFTLAFHTITCYFFNGINKVSEPDWRNGKFVRTLSQIDSYSIPIVKAKTKVIKLKYLRYLSLFIISLQISFILTPFLPFSLLLFILISTIFFHIYIALVMGLNSFFWVFISTYPSIIYTNIEVHKHLS